VALSFPYWRSELRSTNVRPDDVSPRGE
jgi:hypothetical protein